MNAQYPITTTPKYNFPLPEENTQLPQKLMELSLSFLKQTQQLQTKSPTADYPKHLTATPTTLKPNPTKTSIVAIDVSSIRLGETETGMLLAVRGAIVWKQNSRYRYLRLGPFPFHITETSKNEIEMLFCQQHHQKRHIQEHTAPNILYIQTKLTTLLERWIQRSISQTTHNSLILWDGSLTAGTPETPVHTMGQLLRESHANQNTILAFSKMTRLLFDGHRITDSMSDSPPPCLLKMENYPQHVGPLRLMGNVYVAKLSKSGYAFRMDVDRQLLHAQTVDAVQKLLGNDLILQSYPETLRLAHIFSTFTATEVLGIQRCVAKEGGVKIVTRPNVRRMLFGRFGKGPEGG